MYNIETIEKYLGKSTYRNINMNGFLYNLYEFTCGCTIHILENKGKIIREKFRACRNHSGLDGNDVDKLCKIKKDNDKKKIEEIGGLFQWGVNK